MNNNNTEQRNHQRFVTRLGAVATTAGAAVGLGNVWRFPYEAGTHGGGAFMLLYVAFIVVLGIPVICAEFIMGRASGKNQFAAFSHFAPGTHWHAVGIIGITSSLMILSFYSVVAGWTMEYFVQSALGNLRFTTQEEYKTTFEAFTTDNWRPLFYTLAFLALNTYVALRGVTKGIERASNVMMPILFALLIAFCINSLTLDGAREGLTFLFKPDFAAITPKVMLGAMGQAFFSLSIGLGCMMTYASYFSASTRLGRTAVTTATLDTVVAIMSSVIIFPAVFTYGIAPDSGPTLVFEVLPSIFNNMPGGIIWSTLFFFLLILASLTSTISMSEISISYLSQNRKMTRRNATIITTGIAMIAASLCALSFGCLRHLTVFGLTIFDIFNSLSSDILLPIGGMLTSIFVGWKISRNLIKSQLTDSHRHAFPVKLVVFSLRYIAPTGIGLVLLNTIGVL